MPINVWDYLREYDELRDEILAAVDRVFRSGRLILGQEGVKFEREMAAYLGTVDGVGALQPEVRNWMIGAPGRTVSLGLCGGSMRSLTLKRFY